MDGDVPIIYRTCGLPILTKQKHTVQLRLNGDMNATNTQTTAAIMRRDAPHQQVLYDGGNLYDPKGNKFVYDIDWSMADFLAKATSFLGLILDVTRAFSVDGDEITGCLLLGEGAIIFVSFGEDFALVKSNHKNKVGHFTVGELVGRDRLYCDVHQGKFDLTGECVALKFIPKKFMNGTIKDRLDTELACLTKLKHTNIQNLLEIVDQTQHIVRLYDYSSTLTGGNIRHYMRGQREGFALVWEQAQVVLIQIISAVTHLHSNGVIHKDLTLDNIGLVTKGSLHQVKLTGFYVCEIVESLDQDLVSPLASVLSYLPPEVFPKPGKENEPLQVKGPPLDVWALGVISFALLSGRKPFSGPDLDCDHNYPPDVIQANIVAGINQCTWGPRVSESSKRIIKRLLARNPAKRPDAQQLYALMTSGDDDENVIDETDAEEDIPADQLSEHWILGQTYTTRLKDENNEQPAHQGIQRTSPPPQTLLPEAPQLLIQEKKVSGDVINAFDTHIQSINDKLLTKLDAVERLTEESKKMDRLAVKESIRRKSGTFTGKINALVPLSDNLNPLSKFDEDLLEMAEKTASQKFRGGRRMSDFTGYSSQFTSADASLSGSAHGLATVAELHEDATKDTGTVSTIGSSSGSTSTPTKRQQTALRSMSVSDVDVSRLVPGSARESEDGLMDVKTKAGVTVPMLSIGTTTSSSSPPLPMLVTPFVEGGSLIRRSSSNDLAALVPIDTNRSSPGFGATMACAAGGGGSLIRRSSSKDLLEALVPIDTNRSSPGIAAMIASVSSRLSYEEMSRPPENEDEIDYGNSQGFKPINKTTTRRGSKTLGLDEKGGLPTITKPTASNKR